MKTGIYGGTFNPIHNGHLHIVGEFRKGLGLDRVLLIPTGTPPHKAAPNLAAPADRLARGGFLQGTVTPPDRSRILPAGTPRCSCFGTSFRRRRIRCAQSR